MMIHRKVTRIVHPAEVLESARFDSHESVRTFLIHFGEIEAALLDEGCEQRVADQLREISLTAARWFCGGAGLQPIPVDTLIPNGPLRIQAPEGYSHYGLFPEQYAASAAKFFLAKRPTKVVCIGIRSIGTSLSAVVAAALEGFGCAVHSFTVRPEDHPFERPYWLPSALAISSDAHCVIVDEGPGLSGSSFAFVAEKLNELGVPDERIVFLPHWNPSGDAFVSQRARDRWRRHEKYVSEAPPPPTPSAKFAGLGRYGEERLEMAEALASAGFTPGVLGLENGYLIHTVLPGDPVRVDSVNRQLLDTMASYLAFRRHAFRRDEATPTGELVKMTEFNAQVKAAPIAPDQGCITDSCMSPEKWRAIPGGFVKLDAVENGDNPFYPGPTDIAWDLAGAITEFQMNQRNSDYLIDAYARAAADWRIGERLPFYTCAYLAFRIGYSRLHGSHAEEECYRKRLRTEECVTA